MGKPAATGRFTSFDIGYYESAGAKLWHTKMSATEIYAERNQGLADEAARRLG